MSVLASLIRLTLAFVVFIALTLAILAVLMFWLGSALR